MKYKIIVDSCGELTPEMKQDERFASAALTLEVGADTIVDDDSFDQADFLRKVAAYPECPKSVPSAQPSQDAEMLPIASSTICWRSSRVVSLIRMLVIGKNRSFQAVAFTPSMSGGSFCICSR